MWRYLAVLCAGLFLTLLIAGKDNGQIRQGLLLEPIHKPLGTPKTVAAVAPAKAEADVAMATFVPVAAPAAAPEPAPQPEAAPVPVSLTPDAPAPDLSLALQEPAPEVVAPAPKSDVFSIADTPPADPSAAEPAAEPAAESAPVAETAPAAAGILWVSANSVNVREGPGTDFGVAGRLTRGEAVTVVGDAGDGWLRIRIEGDGLEGFVAARLLSATAP